jgi:integrase/recombinase XerC
VSEEIQIEIQDNGAAGDAGTRGRGEIQNPKSKIQNPEDLLSLLLADKRSQNTQRAYRVDLTDFFQSQYGAEPSPELLRVFLAQGTERIAYALAVYKGDLIARKLSEATVNRRLAALNSLLTFARRVGATDAVVTGLVRGEKVIPYRDTAGITPAQARILLQQPDRSAVKGKRDYAILLLLLENALRSAEVRGITVEDFRPDERALRILGKGRGTQKETITINLHTVQAIQDYLVASPHASNPQAALFQNLHRSRRGGGLSGTGLYRMVGGYARQAGLTGTLSPHRLRHTAITSALLATGGDVVQVQQLSRHARVETVVRYNDNRAGHQARVTALLGTLYEEADVEETERE